MGRDWSIPEYPDKPWEKRKRATPLRTYSGSIKYDRPTHYFSDKDLERIMRKYKEQQGLALASQGTLQRLLGTVLSFLLDVLQALEPFDVWGFNAVLAQTLQQAIIRISYMAWEPWNENQVIEMIQLLATRNPKLEVTIKVLP